MAEFFGPEPAPVVTGSRMRRNVFAALVGNGTYAASQFAIVLIMARTTSPAVVGQYSFALAVAAPVFLLFDLKLRIVQVSDAGAVNRSGDYFALRFITTAIALLSISALAALRVFSAETSWLLLAVAAYKAAESVNDIYYGAMQRRHELPLVARSQVLRAAVALAIVGAILAATHRVVLAIGSSAIAMGFLAWRSAYRARALGVDIAPRAASLGVLVRLARTALPVGLAVSVGSLFTNVPRYFIRGHLGDSELGIYSVMAYALIATGLVAQGIAESALPRLADLFVAGHFKSFTSTLWRLISFGALIGLAGLVLVSTVGRQVMTATFGDVYARNIDALKVLMLAAAVQYVGLFLGVAINALRLFVIELPVNLVGFCSLVLGSAILVPGGLIGAATAVLIAQCVITVGYFFLYVTAVKPRLAPKGALRMEP